MHCCQAAHKEQGTKTLFFLSLLQLRQFFPVLISHLSETGLLRRLSRRYLIFNAAIVAVKTIVGNEGTMFTKGAQ